MKKLSLSEIQKEEMNILCDFVDFLDVYNITYYLCGGTLLGAIRHKGFIPWDDDVDIIIPRPDYEKVLGLIRSGVYKSSFECTGYELNNSTFPFIKVINKNIKLDCKNKIDDYLWIDVFPLDGYPNEKRDYFRKIRLFQILFFLKRDQLLKAPYMGNSLIRKYLKKIVLFFMIPLNLNIITDKLISLCKKNDYESSDYAGSLIWSRDINRNLKKEWLKDTILVDFEGRKFKSFSGYDQYLKNTYGEYMKIPKDADKETHLFEAWRVENEK